VTQQIGSSLEVFGQDGSELFLQLPLLRPFIFTAPKGVTPSFSQMMTPEYWSEFLGRIQKVERVSENGKSLLAVTVNRDERQTFVAFLDPSMSFYPVKVQSANPIATSILTVDEIQTYTFDGVPFRIPLSLSIEEKYSRGGQPLVKHWKIFENSIKFNSEYVSNDFTCPYGVGLHIYLKDVETYITPSQ